MSARGMTNTFNQCVVTGVFAECNGAVWAPIGDSESGMQSGWVLAEHLVQTHSFAPISTPFHIPPHVTILVRDVVYQEATVASTVVKVFDLEVVLDVKPTEVVDGRVWLRVKLPETGAEWWVAQDSASSLTGTRMWTPTKVASRQEISPSSG